MAAIVDEDRNLDLQELTSALQRSLPAYARPVFLRLLNEVDTTGDYLTVPVSGYHRWLFDCPYLTGDYLTILVSGYHR